MEWHEVVMGLRRLEGDRVQMEVGEVGGAAAMPVVISGSLKLVEHTPDEPGFEMLTVAVGDNSNVMLEESLLDASEVQERAVVLDHATVRLSFYASPLEPVVTDGRMAEGHDLRASDDDSEGSP